MIILLHFKPIPSPKHSNHSPKKGPDSKSSMSSSYYYYSRLSIVILSLFSLLFVFSHISCLDFRFRTMASVPLSKPWPFTPWFGAKQISSGCDHENVTTARDLELESLSEKLRDSVTFLPLKDLRYSEYSKMLGPTWFMSSLNETFVDGKSRDLHFPSEATGGRTLCLKGRDSHDGSRNEYALAWPGFLPRNATIMRGLTFVSYNHYIYDNIFHGLMAIQPFAAWLLRNGCRRPDRWVLYHWGEIRNKMGTWVGNMTEATFGGPLRMEAFDGVKEGNEVCFEEAMVVREGKLSKERKLEAYDLMRCRARSYCNVSLEGRAVIGMTMFMRTGPRSFRNDSAVIDVFRKECAKFKECRLTVAYSNNLTVCEQVKLMSSTDILVSPHGAQLTNLFLMDRDSSVMEFFPKGWLKLAGQGQYVFHWIATSSGMRHQGDWRDPTGDPCPYPEDDPRCMSIFKHSRIGHNETYFAEWARKVLGEVKGRKAEESSSSIGCKC